MRWMLIALLAGLSFLVQPGLALAGFDSPGGVSFDFLADETTIYRDFESIPADAGFFQGTADAFFSSDASAWGEHGVFIWAGFELQAPNGPRHGILLFDMDLSQAPLDLETPIPDRDVRVEYLEKSGDDILFAGIAVVRRVWLIDVLFHDDDDGGLEGDFALIVSDPTGVYAGCRVFLRGMFSTVPSPARLRHDLGMSDPVATGGGDVYVETGCHSDGVWADPACDCGGDAAYEESADADGCEGDTGGSSGCEGDGLEGGDGCGDAGGDCGDCAGDALAATRNKRLRAIPFRLLNRWLPWLMVIGFVVWQKRRNR